jgi:DNA-binding transcriptional ArsR family regulator
MRISIPPSEAGVVPLALLVAFVLGLAPAGIGHDASAEAGPVSVDLAEELDVRAGPASLGTSDQGVALQAPLLDPVAVPVCLDCPVAPLLATPGKDTGAGPASGGAAAILQDATPAEVAAGTSVAAVLLGAAVWIARAAGFLPWFSSFSRIEDGKLADHPTRRQALDFIAANPGATLQDVRRALGIAWGTTVHHLGRLERAGLVAVRRVGGKRGHWPLGQAPARDALPAPAGALAALVLAEPGLPQGELARRLGLLAPAACKHLARLESAGLVAAQRAGRQRLYLPTRQLAATLA